MWERTVVSTKSGERANNRLNKKGRTDKGYCVIIVTHDPEVAAACDVQYRMHGGTLIAS